MTGRARAADEIGSPEAANRCQTLRECDPSVTIDDTWITDHDPVTGRFDGSIMVDDPSIGATDPIVINVDTVIACCDLSSRKVIP